MTYSVESVPVAGGDLTVGIWGHNGPLVVAAHGITGSHLAWGAIGPLLAEDHRFVAPDLRGRGRSRDLPAPYGMAAHAADLAAVFARYGSPTVLVGHSMGAFAAVATARRFPELVPRLVLVDGGAPLPLPPGVDSDAGEERIADAIATAVGPAYARLSMTFPSREAYREMWRAHPSLADWNGAIEAYVDYDLIGDEPDLRPCCLLAAALRDARDLYAHDGVTPEPLPVPAVFLRAERGILNEETPFYAEGYPGRWLPGIDEWTVAAANHYSILLGPTGAAAVAAAVRAG